MKQTLFYIPSQIFGIELFGVGILFWLIIAITGINLIRSVLQKGKSNDVGGTILMGLIAAMIVVFVVPNVLEADGFPIRGYGVFLTIAITLASFLVIVRGKKLWNIPAEILLSIAVVGVIFGIIGARIFYIVEYWDQVSTGEFRSTFINMINMTSGGLVVYGSIIGGILAIFVYLLIKKIPIWATLDLFAPGLMLGIAIGRIGCLMNGCCFGSVCDLPWAIQFPTESPAHFYQMEHGEASLFGLTLKMPELEKSKTLLALKSNESLWSFENAPVIIESVDLGSNAEKAGLKPGMQIKELGFEYRDPSETLSPNNAVNNNSRPENQVAQNSNSVSVPKRGVSMFAVQNNAQVFNFFFNVWRASPSENVLMVAEEISSENNQPETKIIAFHPEPSAVRPVHPTQIYSSLSAFFICLILIGSAKYFQKDGMVFVLLLVLYPLNRFCLELIRTDEASFWGTGLTVSQCVSILVICFAFCLFCYLNTQPAKRAFEGRFPSKN
ncbi:MAG: prolipoprotein diacylglyceryl transferase [Planctomycetia bacterium]|nr:prolipoprotein diacylglyceryl transferase [Planctomycetia bacterium]